MGAVGVEDSFDFPMTNYELSDPSGYPPMGEIGYGRLYQENLDLKTKVASLEGKVRFQEQQLDEQSRKIEEAEISLQSANRKIDAIKATEYQYKVKLDQKDEQISELNRKNKQFQIKLDNAHHEKNRVVAQTSEDAKKIRELWQATMSKHRKQKESYSKAVAEFEEDRANFEADIDDLENELETWKNKVNGYEELIAQLKADLSIKDENIEKLKILNDLTREKFQAEKTKSEKLHSRLQLATQENEILAKERKHAFHEVKQMQKKLVDTIAQSECIQEEYVVLIEKHEETLNALQQESDSKRNEENKIQELLKTETKYAEDILRDLTVQIGEHDYLLGFINRKLSSIQTKSRKERTPLALRDQVIQDPQEIDTNSLSIFGQIGGNKNQLK